MRRLVLLSVLATACGGGQRIGKIVTEVTPSPTSPNLLLVRSCDLVETGKGNLDQIAVDNCKRFGVRRSPIVPVPVSEARVIGRDHRIITAFSEREGGGAKITTCRLTKTREQKWALLDCAETAIATAPLEAAEAPPPPPPPAPAPPPPAPDPVTP